MHAQHVCFRHGEQGQRITGAQILCGGEGKLSHVVERADVFRAGIPKLGAVLRASGQNMSQSPAHAFQLPFLQFAGGVMRNETLARSGRQGGNMKRRRHGKLHKTCPAVVICAGCGYFPTGTTFRREFFYHGSPQRKRLAGALFRRSGFLRFQGNSTLKLLHHDNMARLRPELPCAYSLSVREGVSMPSPGS